MKLKANILNTKSDNAKLFYNPTKADCAAYGMIAQINDRDKCIYYVCLVFQPVTTYLNTVGLNRYTDILFNNCAEAENYFIAKGYQVCSEGSSITLTF